MSEFDTESDGSTIDPGSFQTTHWNVVLGLKAGDAPQGREALAQLCQSYWYPLYAYVRRQGTNPQDAQDLIQGFFARILEKQDLLMVDRAKGKFRSFLLIALKHYMVNEWVREHRMKRGGHLEIVSLGSNLLEQQYLEEPATDPNPETEYDRRWAMALLRKVLHRLRDEFAAAGQTRIFAELEGFLNGEAEPSAYAPISERLGMSPAKLRGVVYRMRSRFRDLLRMEIACTVNRPDDVDQEIRDLQAALR